MPVPNKLVKMYLSQVQCVLLKSDFGTGTDLLRALKLCIYEFLIIDLAEYIKNLLVDSWVGQSWVYDVRKSQFAHFELV
jgi:hypothetical protein